MDFNTALTNLNIDLGDSDNFTFTAEEKTRALTDAWNDPYNTSKVWDETTTYDQSTYSYALPSGVDTVKQLYYKGTSTSFPEPLGSDAWEVVNGYIKIASEYQYVMAQGSTIVVKGEYQLTTSDSLASDRQEYVLKLARFNTLSLLGSHKVNKFLKNDTSMAEIVAQRRDLERELAIMRRRFNSGVERV